MFHYLIILTGAVHCNTSAVINKYFCVSRVVERKQYYTGTCWPDSVIAYLNIYGASSVARLFFFSKLTQSVY